MARPLTAGEEELQLQLALAMSREEAEKDERRRRSDDVRLQLAISQSQQDFRVPAEKKEAQQSHLLDLLDVNLGNPVVEPPHLQGQAAALDPWGLPPSPPQRPQQQSSEAWSGVPSPAECRDPWSAPVAADPWAPLAQSKSPMELLTSPSSELEEFDIISHRAPPAITTNGNNNHHHANTNGTALSPDPFDLAILGDNLNNMASTGAVKKSPSAFLGENSSLVNLDKLVAPAPAPALAANPFAPLAALAPSAPAAAPRHNLFQQQQQQARVTINELKQQQMGVAADPWAPAPRTASPWAPAHNPFLS